MPSDIYQLKLALSKKVFSFSKTGPAPVWEAGKSYKPQKNS